jgi:hypothetical protein
MEKIFRALLIFEVLAMLLVTAIFRVITPKSSAAMVAGSVFVFLGLAILVLGLRVPQFRSSLTFKVGLIHLFLTSLPMLILRAIHIQEDFKDVRILGLPGPAFHHLSEIIYLVLLLVTAFEKWRAMRNSRLAAEERESAQ